MLPEYKLYHGAVLAEIVQQLGTSVLIDELDESGRLSSYVLNDSIGVYVKHSGQRIRPWQFTFTPDNLSEIAQLHEKLGSIFTVFVGPTMGMLCLTWDELLSVMDVGGSGQAWIRIDRPRGKQYAVFGTKGALANKKPSGLSLLLEKLAKPIQDMI